MIYKCKFLDIVYESSLKGMIFLELHAFERMAQSMDAALLPPPAMDAESELYSDDELQNYTVYYDFNIYTKEGSYKPIEKALKAELESVGFQWQMGRDSPDMYEDDTGYFHKTVCMSYERSN